MKKILGKRGQSIILLIVLGLLLIHGYLLGQQPVGVGQPMPDFTLMSAQGDEISLSQFKGRNVMLMFPRGRVGDHWCQICHYQYAELADLEKENQIREKYNLEILYVLPYAKEEVDEWVEIFPHQMDVIEGWKNPPNPDKLSPGRKAWMERARAYFPKKFVFDKQNIPTAFPVLIDADQKVSKDLGLFTMYWDRSYVEQNISTIYIIDAEGIVQFKYHSQNTFDRPGMDYLVKVLDRMLD